MPITNVVNTQFQQFVDFAETLRNPATSRVVVKTGDVVLNDNACTPLEENAIVAKGRDFVGNVGRLAANKRANDDVRNRFRAAVADMFGGEKNIPDSVRAAMRLDQDFDKGKPLTARRIIAVRDAIVALNRQSVFELPGVDADELRGIARAKGFFQKDFGMLSTAATLYAEHSGLSVKDALRELVDKHSVANAVMRAGCGFLKDADSFGRGLQELGALPEAVRNHYGYAAHLLDSLVASNISLKIPHPVTEENGAAFVQSLADVFVAATYSDQARVAALPAYTRAYDAEHGIDAIAQQALAKWVLDKFLAGNPAARQALVKARESDLEVVAELATAMYQKKSDIDVDGLGARQKENLLFTRQAFNVCQTFLSAVSNWGPDAESAASRNRVRTLSFQNRQFAEARDRLPDAIVRASATRNPADLAAVAKQVSELVRASHIAIVQRLHTFEFAAWDNKKILDASKKLEAAVAKFEDIAKKAIAGAPVDFDRALAEITDSKDLAQANALFAQLDAQFEQAVNLDKGPVGRKNRLMDGLEQIRGDVNRFKSVLDKFAPFRPFSAERDIRGTGPAISAVRNFVAAGKAHYQLDDAGMNARIKRIAHESCVIDVAQQIDPGRSDQFVTDCINRHYPHVFLEGVPLHDKTKEQAYDLFVQKVTNDPKATFAGSTDVVRKKARLLAIMCNQSSMGTAGEAWSLAFNSKGNFHNISFGHGPNNHFEILHSPETGTWQIRMVSVPNNKYIRVDEEDFMFENPAAFEITMVRTFTDDELTRMAEQDWTVAQGFNQKLDTERITLRSGENADKPEGDKQRTIVEQNIPENLRFKMDVQVKLDIRIEE